MLAVRYWLPPSHHNLLVYLLYKDIYRYLLDLARALTHESICLPNCIFFAQSVSLISYSARAIYLPPVG